MRHIQRAQRVVFPAQRVEWDIKIETPHDIYIDWLMHRVEGEIEKSARGEKWGCYSKTHVMVHDYNTLRNRVEEDTVAEYGWIVTEQTDDTLKIFLIGPVFLGRGSWLSKSGFNYEVKSRKVVKAWGEKFSLQQI